MADLEFSGTPEQRQAQGESFMRRIHSDYYGNGRVGTMELTRSFISGFEATERERERQQAERHQENSEKLDEINSRVGRRSLAWTIAGVMVAIAAVLVSLLAILVSIKVMHASDIELRDLIFHSTAPVYSSFFNAHIPDI